MMHRFLGSAEFLAVSKLLFEFDLALDFVLET